VRLLILLQQQMEQVAQEIRRLLLRHKAAMVATALPPHLTMVVEGVVVLALLEQTEQPLLVETVATEPHHPFLVRL
jgi:hypothetical protein